MYISSEKILKNGFRSFYVFEKCTFDEKLYLMSSYLFVFHRKLSFFYVVYFDLKEQNPLEQSVFSLPFFFFTSTFISQCSYLMYCTPTHSLHMKHKRYEYNCMLLFNYRKNLTCKMTGWKVPLHCYFFFHPPFLIM